MDKIDWKIINTLQSDGRMTYTELSKNVHLSVPAVKDRVKRLEDLGVIEGYAVKVNYAVAGYAINAMIGITVPQPLKKKFLKLLDSIPEVLECQHVTGSESYLFKVIVADLMSLEKLIERINTYGETRTSIVMSTPIMPRGLNRQ